jgi:endonuclease-3 related protein
LHFIYRRLYAYFGSQHWWPAKTPLEVAVGAVLTQNTSWRNVERAIANLRRERLLSMSRLERVGTAQLAVLLKPSGYYNIKAKRLKNLLEFFLSEYRGDLLRAVETDTATLRGKLLRVNGIGEETADSILLYAFKRPVFVVDAYSRRILQRHGFINGGEDYGTVQKLFMQNLKCDVKLFNEYHALIVRLGKEFCLKNTPGCLKCPLNSKKFRC